MRVLMMLSLVCLLAACQSGVGQSGGRSPYSPSSCGPGGMGCPQGPMPYGDIDGAVGGSSGK
jgi:hypothetical protein